MTAYSATRARAASAAARGVAIATYFKDTGVDQTRYHTPITWAA